MDKYRTFLRRFIALLIDGLLIGIVLGMITRFFMTDIPTIDEVISIINSFIPFGYSIIMIARYGQTIGKMAMKIKIVDYETEQDVNYNQALRREAVPIFLVILSIVTSRIILRDADYANYGLSIISWILLLIPSTMSIIWSLLEMITMLFDSKSRALHDKIADTVVIKTYERW